MTTASALDFYLIPMDAQTVFTGRVASAPSEPYITIAYNTGVTGAFGDPIAGMTVHFGTTSGGSERGKRRLRAYSGNGTGTITIDESDDVGPQIQANDYITIKAEFRLWPKYPRVVQSGLSVTIWEDYDIAYTNQTDSWRPIANAGPPAVAFLEGGSATVSFVGDQSFTLASGATITNYLWTAWNSSESTSTSQGSQASPVVFTWTTPGRHLVSLKVTDSNGFSHTNYTWVVIIDPASPTDFSFPNFDTTSDSFDWSQGGGECSFMVHTTADVSDFPEEMMVIHAARGTITSSDQGSWPFRENVLFVGWVMSNSVRQNTETGQVSFRAGTISQVMRNTSIFPVSLTDSATPVNWTQAANLNVDRAASFLWEWRSTLSIMTPIIPTSFAGLIRRQDFGPSDLFSELQNSLISSILGKVVSSHQSVLYHSIDYNVQDTDERALASTGKTLHKGIWLDDVFIDERSDYQWTANIVKMSGVYYPGGQLDDLCPIFSEAPGTDSASAAMKAYGRETNFDRMISTGQGDINVRSGLKLAQLNTRYPKYRLQFINEGSFNVAKQDLFPAIIEAGDNNRGLSFSGNLIARRMSRQYDHTNGYFTVSVDFEPVTSGPAGVTVEMPCGPPEQKLPYVPPPPSGDPGPSGKTSLMAGTTGSSWYWSAGVGSSWDQRVSGLSASQKGFLHTEDDPWSAFKQGYNPNNIIVWGCGRGFVAQSDNSGKTWKNRTSALDPAPNWPGESDNDLDNMEFSRINFNIFVENETFVLGAWQYTGAWHGAVAASSDGFSFTWFSVTGAAQVRPLGMSIERGAGNTLYVTTWESGTLYLRAYNITDMSLAGRYSLGSATLPQVEDYTYHATPFNRIGVANEVFVYGRMNAPQGFTGSVHILKNTNYGGGGSYSVIENTWGIDHCGSFGADADDYYYAVRNSGAAAATYGYWMGGYSGSPNSPVATTDRITFSSGVTAANTDSDLSTGRDKVTALSDTSTYGYCSGGQTGVGVEVAITDRITFSSGVTVANTDSDLSVARGGHFGLSDGSTYGYWAGGEDISFSFVVTADRITFSSGVTAANTDSDLSTGRTVGNNTGLSDGSTYGYFNGGATLGVSWVATSDRITFSTGVTAAAGASDLTTIRGQLTSLSDQTTYGYFLGGRTGSTAGTEVTQIDRLTFSTMTTVSNTDGSLATARWGLASSSDGAVYGYVAGGYDGVSVYATAERFSYSSATSAANTDSDLSTVRTAHTGLSDGAV